MKMLTSKWLIVASLLMAITCPVFAEEATVDGVTYTYSVSDGNATITGVTLNGKTSLEIPGELTDENGNISKVTSLNFRMYVLNPGGTLKSVVIPSTVTSVHQFCFAMCTGLNRLTFEEGGTALALNDACFMGCSALESIVLPQHITWIGNNCFGGTTSLKYAVIPTSNLTHVGTGTRDVINNIVFNGSNKALSVILTGKPNSSLSTETAYYGIYYNNLLRLSQNNDSYYDVSYPVEYTEEYEPLFSITSGNVYAYRNNTTAQYSTVCLPYQIDVAGSTGIEQFYEDDGEGLNVEDADNKTITFKDVNTEQLNAGQPYVFKRGTASAFDGIGNFSHCIAFKLYNYGSKSDLNNSTYLKGTFADIMSGPPSGETDRYYLLQSGVFKKWVDAGAWLNAYRAYLDLGESSNAAKMLKMKFSQGQASGIAGVSANQVKRDGKMYDLQGRVITSPARGQLYIQNGQKHIAR